MPAGFTRAYANAVTCGPSRAALMSGRFAERFSLVPGYIRNYGFPSWQPTLTEMLSDNGYLTMHAVRTPFTMPS